MTKKQFLLDEFFNSLSAFMKTQHFVFHKANRWYTKKENFGLARFHLICLNRDSSWEIVPEISIRVDIVENLYHQISHFEKKYQKSTATVGMKMEEYLRTKQNDRFDLQDEVQIDQAVKWAINLFHLASNFFREYADITEIDENLNSDPQSISLTGAIYKGFKAIIVARIVERKDYSKLVVSYRKYYENFSEGFYLSEYERLIDLLDKTTIESY